MQGTEIWQADAKGAYSALSSSEKGLTSQEAAERLVKYGPNSIPEKDRKGWPDILLSQFNNPLLLILIFASIIAILIGDIFDTYIIFLIIGVSVLLGFVQEYKSERTIAALRRLVSYHAIVLRDGARAQLDAHDLVPGDVVFVGLGDIVPADMRILETSGISVDESVLTGESREVRKSADAVKGAAATPQERANCLFMGTPVVSGYAKAIVAATGKETFFGRTASVFSAKVPESDFQIEIRKFGSLLVRVITVLTLFIFLSNYALGHGDANPMADSALFALALAVGIAPEALPIIITITLSSGSLHLARKKVVTKKLAAIEDLGNMDVLCTDKTGTLTEGELEADRFVDAAGNDSEGLFRYAFLCNSAVGTIRVRGNAIDAAIRRRGVAGRLDVSAFEKLGEVPFDFERRRMGQALRNGKKTLLVVKGAPDSVLSACSHVRMGTADEPISRRLEAVQGRISGYSAEGNTVIAVAAREIAAKGEYSVEDERGLSLLGFVLLSNRPKHSAQFTLERLRRLNVRLVILTGDDPQVTRKLCSAISFCPPGGRIVLGSELEALEGEALVRAVEECDVFARVTPEQKLLIIETLRKNGHVVGFLGDGINDAPALRAADIGISVDTAADVAKGASHIILLKKSLNVICDGVEEGRRIFGNITKYILNTMSANQGNMITVSLSSLVLPFIPILPSQILLNNLLSDVPLLSISGDNVDRQYTEKPQKWDMGMIFKFMLFFGLISTAFDILFIAVLYLGMRVDVETFRTAWFLESVLSEMLIVFSLRTRLPFFRSMPAAILVAASIGAGALSTGLIYFAPVAGLFHFVPLGTPILVLTAGTLAAYFAATELGKAWFFRRIKPNHGNATAHPAMQPHAPRE